MRPCTSNPKTFSLPGLSVDYAVFRQKDWMWQIANRKNIKVWEQCAIFINNHEEAERAREAKSRTSGREFVYQNLNAVLFRELQGLSDVARCALLTFVNNKDITAKDAVSKAKFQKQLAQCQFAAMEVSFCDS